MDQTDRVPISLMVAEYALRLDDGDLSALARLYEISAARLLRFAQALARNREDAEDALQAAMIRIAENPKRLSGAQHPWAYFLKIVRNETLKVIGRRRPAQSISNVLGVWTLDDAPLERKEWQNRVRTTLQRLPPAQAEVVMLKIWENMTFLEIAVVIGESANTAASRYRYALEKLSRYLKPISDEVLK